MNNEKLILEIIEGNEIIIKKFKSLLDLSKNYPTIPYHSLRGLYLSHIKEEKTKKKVNLRKCNSLLSKKFKIYDNPEYLQRFEIL